MPDYFVEPQDLHGVADHLGLQADALDLAQVETEQATRDVTATSTDALALAEQQLTARLDVLTETATASRETAESAVWTGPDADTFRAANLELVQRIEAAIQAMRDAFVAYQDACRQALGDLQALEQRFTAGCRAYEGDRLRLRTAVDFEADHYVQAFDGSFGY
jgi:hypothetical protein